MKLIVGLGNPGEDYAQTRHNIGFNCLNHIARKHGLSFTRREAHSRLAQGQIGGQEVLLAKPFTFMNRSGAAVAALMRKYQIQPADLVVIYDDMDLPVGKLRLRPSGSAGGHHGMESIIAALGSQDFPRIRVGIGKPIAEDAISFVLSHFTPEEKESIAQALGRVGEAVEMLLTQGVEAAMNQFNRDT